MSAGGLNLTRGPFGTFAFNTLPYNAYVMAGGTAFSGNAAGYSVPAFAGTTNASFAGSGTVSEGGSAMSEHPTREEMREVIKDKLEAVEARIDAKLIGIDSKIDRLSDNVQHLVTQVGDVKADNKSTRTTIVVTVVVAVLAALAAIVTVQIGLLSAVATGLAAHH